MNTVDEHQSKVMNIIELYITYLRGTYLKINVLCQVFNTSQSLELVKRTSQSFYRYLFIFAYYLVFQEICSIFVLVI